MSHHLARVLVITATLAGCRPAEPDREGRGRRGGIEITAGYAFSPVGPEAAAYLSLQNRGRVEDTLLSITSPLAGMVMLHESRTEGGAVRMSELGTLVLPPGLAVEMAPGGLHLMLTDLRVALPAGKRLPLRLQFARAGLLEIEVPISRYGETH